MTSHCGCAMLAPHFRENTRVPSEDAGANHAAHLCPVSPGRRIEYDVRKETPRSRGAFRGLRLPTSFSMEQHRPYGRGVRCLSAPFACGESQGCRLAAAQSLLPRMAEI